MVRKKLILWLGFFLGHYIENSNMKQTKSPLQAPLKKFPVKLHLTYINLFLMRWTPASQMRVLLSPTKTPMCRGLVTPVDALGHWKRQSHAKPGHRCVAKPGRFPRWTGTKPAVETGHVAVMSLGKEFQGLETSQPTNHHFSEVWKSSKKARPLQKMYPLFFGWGSKRWV